MHRPSTMERANSSDIAELELPLFGGSSAPPPVETKQESQSVPDRIVRRLNSAEFESELVSFRDFGQPTRQMITNAAAFDGRPLAVRTYVNEYWTARQRQASSLHEVSYRACFKPQLPRFFIERLTDPGDFVYDPFMGRGTTLLEAA